MATTAEKTGKPAARDETNTEGEAAAAKWTTADSAELYSVDRWGQDYFRVNKRGHVVVHPTCEKGVSVDLKQLVDELEERGLETPLLIRFDDIIRHRARRMHETFSHAIEEFDYQGDYRCVYPIKVNQQRHVVEQVLEAGREYGFGLEAGSKPELLAVMAMVWDETTPIICNGFKDREFIEAVILSAKMGRHIIPVVEKFSELELIAEAAQEHDVRPAIGLRVKLASRGAGRWENSGGDRSKFGLFFSELVAAVEYLRERDMLDCLKLLHFHLGSQINNIRNIKSAIIELARVYVELHKAGAGLEFLDVGGGLGVDYDGSKSSTEPSINYSLQEYANDIVFHVRDVCNHAEVPHPTLISESGRALIAYHSVLVFNVVGSSGFDRFEVPGDMTAAERKKLPKPVVNLFDSLNELGEKNYAEVYHDAQLAREETQNLFNLGYCDLQQRALGERLFYTVCSRVLKIVETLEHVPEEFAGLDVMLSRIYFCNFSIFQSLPDAWAVDQLFPIMPIHRLNEEPTDKGILADISCDSDGKIDQFIGQPTHKPLLELHSHRKGEPYYLAAFLVGAYQEILGDMHNLFGDTHAVHVRIDEDGEPEIEEVVEGDTVSEVLQYVQFSTDELKRGIRKRIERAVRRKQLTLTESRTLLRFYENGLEGYTYLE